MERHTACNATLKPTACAFVVCAVSVCSWRHVYVCTTGPVGITAVMDQVRVRAKKRGFDFNLMVVGESGLGKSTLVDTLFRANVSTR